MTQYLQPLAFFSTFKSHRSLFCVAMLGHVGIFGLTGCQTAPTPTHKPTATPSITAPTTTASTTATSTDTPVHTDSQADLEPTTKPIVKSQTKPQVTLQVTPQATTTPAIEGDAPKRLTSFNIRGKIGIASSHPKVQSGSAYYGWAQQDERFTIDITGALGIGRTVITYDGNTATLTNGQAGTVTADDPEVLLAQATGIQAPINELPYWISGSHAPSDDRYSSDALGRIQQAVNGRWQADFSYDSDTPSDRLPSKIKVNYATYSEHFYRIILIIDHVQ